MGTGGSRSMASLLIAERRFKTLLKCSAHLSRIFSVSVIKVDPSVLKRKEAPGAEGLGKFSTVMQTLNFVSDLYNCLEFS